MVEPPIDIFLTHDWGFDEEGRNNHDRVALVNTAMKEMGYSTWFDSDRMIGDVAAHMAAGIEDSKAVVVFLTERYSDKVGLISNSQKSIVRPLPHFITLGVWGAI